MREPLMKAFGDDVNEILDYLNEMDIDDLDEISGIFEDIYGKFMTEEVWNALEALEKKIEDAKAEMNN
jgi:pyruvate/oxaloacetate carboxyltransferase